MVFYRVGQDIHVAEDLTQQTFIEAWNNRDKLVDSAGVAAWLYAIAQNIYRRWTRQTGREQSRFTDLDEEALPSENPVEIELSRNELADLLDRTLHELPAQTQQIIIMRYLEELPQARVAELLGISESAVAVKLHRGKLQLRLRLDAEANGDTGQGDWQQTNIWCPTCGNHRYQGLLDTQTGRFLLRCPNCSPSNDLPDWGDGKNSGLAFIKGLSTFKPALNRFMNYIQRHITPALAVGKIACDHCGTEVEIHRGMPPEISLIFEDNPGVHYICPRCQNLNYCALSGIAISTPEMQSFWKTHSRVQQLPIQRVEHEGRDVIVLTAASVNMPTAQLSAFFDQTSYQLLKVEGTGGDYA